MVGASRTISRSYEVTKEISFPATVTMADGVLSATSEFALNRMDFGIAFTGKPDDLIREEVVMQLEITTAADEM